MHKLALLFSRLHLRNVAPDRVLSLHRHPFAMPVAVFLVLFFSGSATFVAFNGDTMGADDTKVVHLYVDGVSQTVPTRAQTVGDMLSRLGIELREGDVTEPAVSSPIVSQDFSINVYRAKPVTIIDNKGIKVTKKVIDSTPNDMAKRAGVTVYPEDKATIAPADQALKNGVLGTQVVIDRATPANINLYGNNIPTRTHAKTVGELLTEKNIKTINGDTVQPSPETPISDDVQVFIISYGKQLVSSEEIIEAPVEKKSDANLPVGTSRVSENGSAGKKVVTYQIELQNGKEVSRKAIQEVVAMQPVKKVILEGTKIVITNPSENVLIGQRLAAERGWTGAEFQCLYQLWQKESGWNHLSVNRYSGAGGIPQAFPATKMASAGADWQTNPATQITWGLNYIAGKKNYRTPCGAWQYWQLHHSY